MRIEEALGGVVVGVDDDGGEVEFFGFIGDGIGLRGDEHGGGPQETDG